MSPVFLRLALFFNPLYAIVNISALFLNPLYTIVNIFNEYSYQLQHSEILLPPEEGSECRSQGREEVVGVHDGVDETVEHTREESCDGVKV